MKAVMRLADFVREARAATNSFLIGSIEVQESDEAGKLFRKRRKAERQQE